MEVREVRRNASEVRKFKVEVTRQQLSGQNEE